MNMLPGATMVWAVLPAVNRLLIKEIVNIIYKIATKRPFRAPKKSFRVLKPLRRKGFRRLLRMQGA